MKCPICDSKIGILEIGIKCRCGGVFCLAHRLPEEHGCTYDFKASEKSKLERENPRVVAEKVEKI